MNKEEGENSLINHLIFQEYKMGDYLLSSRIGMAALTRMRADNNSRVPNDLHVEYYSQRAEAAFILTECSGVSVEGSGIPMSCGIYSNEQVEGWKKVTKAVHDKGGKIFLQIWHSGRCGHESVIKSKPLSSSSVKNRFMTKNDKLEMVECHEPIEMSTDDIKKVLKEFEDGAINAKKAGFDGLELHAANGYLIDQFLRDGCNKRTDEYGGSIENRCKFPLEVIDKLIGVFGAGKVGIKISPCGRLNDMFDSNPLELYKYFLKQLGDRNVAFVEIMQAPDFRLVKSFYDIPGEDQIKDIFKTLKEFFVYKDKNVEYKPTLIANNNLDLKTAKLLIENNHCDMVTFGRMFISNPDLISRLKNDYELNVVDQDTLYSQGEKGYTDYKFYSKTN